MQAGEAELLRWLLTKHGLQHTPVHADSGRPGGIGGNTPLHVAATSKRWEAAQLLVQSGADVKMQNDDRKLAPLTIGWQKANSTHSPGFAKLLGSLRMSDVGLGCRADVPQKLAQPRGIPCSGGGHWVSWGREWKDSKIARKVCVRVTTAGWIV